MTTIDEQRWAGNLSVSNLDHSQALEVETAVRAAAAKIPAIDTISVDLSGYRPTDVHARWSGWFTGLEISATSQAIVAAAEHVLRRNYPPRRVGYGGSAEFDADGQIISRIRTSAEES